MRRKNDTTTMKQIDRSATGRAIRMAIQDSGLTVLEASEYLGLETPRVLYRWFRGDSLPSIGHLLSLGSLTGRSLDELVAASGEQDIPAIPAAHIPEIKKEKLQAPLLFEYPRSGSACMPLRRKDTTLIIYRHILIRAGYIPPAS